MTPIDNNCPESVRRFFRRIGSRGGQAGKGTELRREINRRNARKRWEKIRADGGTNFARPKGRPKKKRPQAKPPKKQISHNKLVSVPALAKNNLPVIGFR